MTLPLMARAKSKADPKRLQGKRILVVEDYPLMGEILSETLSDYGHASHVLTGRDALQQIERNAPDVILLDLNLPDMNGLEVIRVLRQNEKTKSIPILAMSGSPMDKRKCLEMGCNDFIPKPFTVSSLLLQLLELIPHHSRSSIPKSPVIDLMQALKQSIEKAKPKQKAAAPAQRKRKTASLDS